MAENNDARLEIEVVGVGNEKSGEQSVKDIQKGINKASNKGRIKVPVDITVPIDNTKTKLTKAQKDITSELSKMMTKGFSASGKDIDALVSKFDKFTKALDAAGKGRQNKIYREIRKQVEELQKSYRALKSEMSTTPTKVSKSSSKKAPKKTAEDRYLDKQEEYSKRSQGAGKRKELYKELDYVRENKSLVKSSNIKPSATNDDLMKLSEYSSYGSKWASELSRILKEEMAKSAKTLVTYIDPIYAKKTKGGRATTEQEFLTATFNDVRKQLKESVAQLELGSEDVTLDLLKEQVAVMKVLGKEVGKTTEQIERSISSAIQSRYSHSETKHIGFASLEEGQVKGVGPGHENTQKILTELYDVMKQWDSEVVADNIAKEMLLSNEKTVKTIEKGRKKVTGSQTDKKVTDVKLSDDYKKELQQLNSASDKTFAEMRKSTTATEKQANIDKIENVREAVSDSNVEKTDKENKDINRDTARVSKKNADTGFDTDSKSDELISLVRNILQQLQLITTKQKEPPKQEEQEKTDTSDKIKEQDKTTKAEQPDYSFEMKAVYSEIENAFEPMKNALAPLENSADASVETPKKTPKSEFDKISGKLAEGEEEKIGVDKSIIYASPFRQGFLKKIEGAFESLTGATRKYEEILRANAEDQDKLAAERIKTYGLNNGRNPNDTGDIAGMRRILQLYRTNKASIEQNPELMQKIQLTKGREVDTTELTKAMNEALSGKRMEKAQNGGGFWKNAFGFMTGGLGYAFMPSLEKSRAQVDGLNQMLGNINDALQSVLINIQTKETELSGMVESGQAEFDKNGYLKPGSSSAAFKTLADLEEEKLVLDSIKADLLANDEIIKKTGGRFPQMVKYLNFTSPVLKENNGILRNINSGLDKNGKALKFQNRLAEILNYTYQLMSRGIGQMIKNWITMANPINLIKKAFSDFGSYDVKWQRTMNVIKYNLRSIILPLMQKIAQLIVNMIGVLDIALQKVQSAFGKTPISLFDQENAKQFKDQVEEIKNVTAGFDELHDIGGDTEKDPNDLTGEIYKPQLSEGWKKFGETLGAIFTGIAKAIKWCIDNWKFLVGLLATFVIAKGLWNLLNFAIGLKNAFSGLAKLPWASIAKGLGWVAAAASTAISAYETVKLGVKWDQMDDKEKNKTMGKSIGFGTLAGGIIGTLIAPGVGTAIGAGLGAAITGGIDSAIADYNGDDARAEITGAIGGAGIGAAIGTLIAPGIGTAVGAAIGTGIGWGVEKLGHLTFSNGGDYSNLKISTEDLAWANEQLATAQDNVYKSLYNLKSMEEQTGESGKALYDAVQNGTLSFDNMSSSQLAVYDAYKSHVGVLEELKAAQQTQMDYETSMDLDRAEKSDNYTDYINKMIEANNNGIYSNEELQDRFAQVYGELDRNSRQVFLEQLPENMRQSVELQGQNYLSNWSKFYDSCCTNWENFKTGWGEFWTGVGETFSTKWEELKTGAATTWENMKTAASTTLEGMKTVVGNVWNSIKIEAGEAWEDIKNSAVGQKVQEIATNVVTKFDEIKNTLTTSWDTLKSNAAIAWDNIKTSIVNAAQNAWNGAKGFFDKIGEGIKNAWEGLKELGRETGQKIGNFFSGKGWKTDAEMASYAIGTNYVPSDGLAYLHQGEAVIPKKYNSPYEPGGMSAEERAYMDRMIAIMNRLDGTIAQGINVKGEFRQRGNDLVATVEKNKSRQSNTVLNNKVYAR